MIFQTLQPLLAERPIHLLLSRTPDGRVRVYIEPKATDKAALGASVAPFSVCDTAENLDAGLADAIRDWLQTRSETLQDIQAGLAASKTNLANAAAKDKKATPASQAKPATPAKKSTSFAAKAPSDEVAAPPAVMVPATNIGATGSDGDAYPLAVAGATANATGVSAASEDDNEE